MFPQKYLMNKQKYILVLMAVTLVTVLFVGGVSILHVTGKIELQDGFLSRAIEIAIIRPADKVLFTEQSDKLSGFQVTNGRVQRPCRKTGESTAVLLSFGQSNAGNSGPVRRQGLPSVLNLNLFDGKCYHAVDPLLGGGGKGGAIWTALGNYLIAKKAFDRVILFPLSVGGSSINRWADPKDLGARFAHAGDALKKAGLKVTHIFFVQGEADHHAAPKWARLRPSEFVRLGYKGNRYSMRTEAYEAHFLMTRKLMKQAGIDASVSIAVKTRCGDYGTEIEGPVSLAQRNLAGKYNDIYPGPDINAFDESAYKPDLCHLSDVGIIRTARIWSRLLVGIKMHKPD
jgi:hypothetical protein